MKYIVAALLAVVVLHFVLAAAPSMRADQPVDGPLDELVPVERVAALAATCAACHGPDGRAQVGIPALAGNPEAVMRAQLLAFRSDEIPGATVMPRLMRGFSEPELKALAAWFAALDAEQESVGGRP